MQALEEALLELLLLGDVPGRQFLPAVAAQFRAAQQVQLAQGLVRLLLQRACLREDLLGRRAAPLRPSLGGGVGHGGGTVIGQHPLILSRVTLRCTRRS